MDSPENNRAKKKNAGTPFWVAVVGLGILFLLVAAGIGGLWYSVRSGRINAARDLAHAQAETARAELAAKQAAQKAELAVARTHQEQMLGLVHTATNVLTRLLAESAQLRNDAASLKTNEAGRVLALYPALVAQARHFYESDVVDLAQRDDIATRLEGARRIEQQLLGAAGTTYEPTPELGATVLDSTSWGNQRLERAGRLRQVLNALVQDSKIKVADATLTPTSPTLDGAIADLIRRETAASQRVLTAETAAANDEAAKMLAKAEAADIIAAAQRKADAINAEAQDKAAKLEREIAMKKAAQQKEDAKTKVAVETAADEARKTELRKKASDPQIQAKLAPFITPGYWQLTTFTIEKKPLSFTGLKNCGALEPTPRGGSTMATIVSSSSDRLRPRWKINPHLYLRYPDAIERIKDAQQLLTELGPVLVDMKLLEP